MTSGKLFGSKISQRQTIIDLLLTNGELSRVDLARLTRFSKPTVSSVVAELIDEGIVREIGYGDSTGGRPPVLLRLGSTRKLIAGVEIDSQLCLIALVDLDGRVLDTVELPVSGTDLSTIVLLIQEGISQLLTHHDSGLIGCGVAVPGLIAPSGERVIYAGTLNWIDVPLQIALEESLGVPVMMTNRGNAAALGTMWLRGRDKIEDLIYIYLGTGVGGGIITGRKLLLGATHGAGEVGHISVDPNGPLCRCGNYGCLETLVSGPAIEMRTRAKIKEGIPTLLTERIASSNLESLTTKMIAQAVLEGDALALEILAETARYLGIAIANMINILNPQSIVLGGPVSRWGDLLVDAVRQEVRKRAFFVLSHAVQIVRAEDEGLAVAIGAAALLIHAADDLFAIPGMSVPDA